MSAVTLPAATLARYERLSLYNSPFPAHDSGRAVDLYPGSDEAPSPVAGTVREVVSTRAPTRPYADPREHLLLVDVDADCLVGESRPLVARLLHVDPAVEPGDCVAVGDSLGDLVRSGYFAPWVDGHIHLGFRTPDRNLRRAAGSLPVAVDVPVRALPWDGRGTVVETGDTWVRLDAPADETPGAWAGLAGGDGVALDGGLPHYAGGGAFRVREGDRRGVARECATVELAGASVGVADGRDVRWDDVTLSANGRDLLGVSCVLARDRGRGAKLVCPGHEFAVGDRVEVVVR